MKRIAYILMVAAVASAVCPDASGETMAERKQRIMRKYLRERQDVVQSDILIPVVLEKDEQVVDSQKYRSDVDLSRRSGSVAPPPVPRVRPIPVQSPNNWMLNQDESEFDPNADPFALDDSEDLPGEKKDWMADWQKLKAERAKAQKAEAEAAASYDILKGRNADSGWNAGYGYSSQQERDSGYSSYGTTPQSGSSGQTSDRQVGPYGYGTYGSSPSSGMLQLPDSPVRSEPDASDRTVTPSYTPYRSPYETRQDQRLQEKTPTQPQEFSRPVPYQQWKNNNKAWDPTADDAYLNELMQRNRR